VQLFDVLHNIPTVQIRGDVSGDVSTICYDSRTCGKNSMFVAICGLKNDGHDFIPHAISNGATFIVHEKDIPLPPRVTAIKVTDSRKILGSLGKNFYNDPSARLCLVGVTGTNGKTTVTYLLESIFKRAGFNVGVLGTINYRFNENTFPAPHTTPESFELQKILRTMADHGVTHVVMEVSSHAADLKRADDCAFDIGIFTNLSQDHLDYHHTMENYFQAKKRFFDEILPSGKKRKTNVMIVNGDDLWGKRLLSEVRADIRVLTFGFESRCDVTADQLNFTLDGIKANIHADHIHFTVVSSLIGRFNLYNILASSATAISLNVPERFIQNGIESLKNVPGRLEMIGDTGQPKVFVDYAHTEDALRRVLQNLSLSKQGNIITVFGCGGDRDRGKRPRMGEVVAELSDFAVITSDNPRSEDPLSIINDIEAGIPKDAIKKFLPEELNNYGKKGYVVIPDRRRAIETAIALADPTDIILIAGKGHENYQIIGNRQFPFDDRIVARDALTHRYRGESH